MKRVRRSGVCLFFVLSSCGRDREELAGPTLSSIPLESLAEADPVPDTRARQIEAYEPPQSQIDEFNAERPKSVIELQQYRQTSSAEIRDRVGNTGTATLVNLNLYSNRWFVLQLRSDSPRVEYLYHVENAFPTDQGVYLDSSVPEGLVLQMGGNRWSCELWSSLPGTSLVEAAAVPRPYVPICGGRLFLRNQTEGHKTTMEWATDFLRDYVAGGEQITVFVRESLYQDAFLSEADVEPARPKNPSNRRIRPPGAPAAASVNPRFEGSSIIPVNLGIDVEKPPGAQVLVGRWYPAANLPGVYVSTISPGVVSEEVIQAQKGQVNVLDEVESRALVYLMAFDLSQFQLGFALGTDHPRVGWSERVLPEAMVPSLPGPDGIDTTAPLVRTGMVRPDQAPAVVAAFTGGFKRYHGAFRRGDLALQNSGTHYGFVESGVLMSKLQPGLATVLVYEDDQVDFKTWGPEDDVRLKHVRHARQNGVPIIEFDSVAQVSRPGSLVSRPALGNWSGSVEGRYRTLRSGVCLQERGEDRFLMYGYFSSATPSAMARVFQAYGCRYAMLMDMNALEHTYLAIYTWEGSRLKVQHLIRGMEVLDKADGSRVVPRFLGYADNRDFFFLMRKRDEP